jgi:ribonuclease HI
MQSLTSMGMGPATVLDGRSLRLFTSQGATSFKLKRNLSIKVLIPDSSEDLDSELTRTLARRLTIKQVREELDRRKMDTHGKKVEMLERLLLVVPYKTTQKSMADTSETISFKESTRTSNEKHERTSSKEITLANNDTSETTSSKESTRTSNGKHETTSSKEINNRIANNGASGTPPPEESNKEPGKFDPGRRYIIRTKANCVKGSGCTGVGIVLVDSDDPTLFWTARKFLSGDRSVFEAEYTALVEGLRYCVRLGARNIGVEIDHDVTVGQLQGVYTVGKETLIPMYQEIIETLDSMESFSISLIKKKENYIAKDLADKALATQTSDIEDSIDSMKGQARGAKKVQKLKKELASKPTEQLAAVETSEPFDAIFFQSGNEQVAPTKPTEQVAPVELSESFDAKTVQSGNGQVEPTKTTEQLAPVEASESPVAETVKRSGIDPTRKYRLEFDGGSRGNQSANRRKAGAGFVLYDDRGVEIACGWAFLNKMTNNCAEYSALLQGVQLAISLGINHLDVFGDSELIVKQMNGVYKVKDPEMKKYHTSVKASLKHFDNVKLRHIFRASNKRADELANYAMDTETTDQEIHLSDELTKVHY